VLDQGRTTVLERAQALEEDFETVLAFQEYSASNNE
jgi:hypothetical protein